MQADWDETDPTSDAYFQHKPTDVSAFNNDAGYITKDSIPTNVSAFNNDAQYVNNSTCDTIDFYSLISLVNQLQTQIKQQDRLIDSLNSAHTDGIPCPGSPTVTDYDGNIYNTVKIGEQCWMKENLRTKHYSDGTEIPIGTSKSFDVAYRYCLNNDTNNVSKYGYLYNWAAVMHGASSSSSNPSGVQGICPSGWHVPSDAEWTQFANYVGSVPAYKCENNSNSIAKALAMTETWNSYGSGQCMMGKYLNTNNATGFSALPAQRYTGTSQSIGELTFFHCATEIDGTSLNLRYLHNVSRAFPKQTFSKDAGYSVRCLRD